VAGLDEGWVPTVLALFGVGALVGTTVGGRVADAHLFGVLLSGIAASTVFLVAPALLGGFAVAAVALSFLLGFSAFYTAPALNARMFDVAGAAPTLAGATTTAAFNLGNTGGPWLGGTVIDAGLGYPATAMGVPLLERSRELGGGRRDDGDGDRRDGGVAAHAPVDHEGDRHVLRGGPQLPTAGRPFGLRSPASVSLRTSSFEPICTAPARTASS
jgi:hypothetical protein